MAPRKRFRKRRRRKRKQTAIINRGVAPIANSFITTLEFNDIINLGNTSATAYGFYTSNGAKAPYVDTNMTNALDATHSPYGWSAFTSLYRYYTVLSSFIKCEIVNQSSTPVVMTLMETGSNVANVDQENVLGAPNGKSQIIAQNEKGILTMSSRPWKLLGLSTKDDTYRALVTAVPATQRHYQISAFSGSVATPANGVLRLTIRYRVKFSDRFDLTQ